MTKFDNAKETKNDNDNGNISKFLEKFKNYEKKINQNPQQIRGNSNSKNFLDLIEEFPDLPNNPPSFETYMEQMATSTINESLSLCEEDKNRFLEISYQLLVKDWKILQYLGPFGDEYFKNMEKFLGPFDETFQDNINKKIKQATNKQQTKSEV